MMFSIYNALQIPYEFGFGGSTFDEPYSLVLDLLIDIFFLVDIFLMFCTTLRDKKGFELKEKT